MTFGVDLSRPVARRCARCRDLPALIPYDHVLKAFHAAAERVPWQILALTTCLDGRVTRQLSGSSVRAGPGVAPEHFVIAGRSRQPASCGQIIALLTDLHDHLGLTYLFISHDRKAECLYFCGRVVVMLSGSPWSRTAPSPTHRRYFNRRLRPRPGRRRSITPPRRKKFPVRPICRRNNAFATRYPNQRPLPAFLIRTIPPIPSPLFPSRSERPIRCRSMS